MLMLLHRAIRSHLAIPLLQRALQLHDLFIVNKTLQEMDRRWESRERFGLPCVNL